MRHLATCARRSPWPRRMSPSVRPDGRPSRGVCKIGSGTGRTAHFRAVGAQRAALIPDVRPPVAPTTIGWPIWPAIDRARPCECHVKITHFTAAAVGVCWHRPRTERLRLTPFHPRCRTCDSPTHHWDFSSNQRELALGADAGCLLSIIMEPPKLNNNPVPLGASQIQTHKPSRRRVAVV